MKSTLNYLLVMFLFGISQILAQNNGEIKGKVIDKITKQPLPGVNVQVMNTNYGSTTDETGTYLIKNIPENIYKLKFSFIGYNIHIEPDIRVIRSKTYYVNEIELSEAPVESKEITVTSGYFNYSKDMPVSNYGYTREEIVRAPGAAGDIFRALEVLPGVATNGGEFSAFSVRGDAPDDNLILIDNIPFSRVSHFSEIDGNMEVQGGRFSIFSQGLIDKADFQSGGYSSKYGGKRASFLNLSVKEGNKESPSFKGSYDLMGCWEINYDGPTYIHNGTSIMLSARGIDFSNLMKMIGEEKDGTSKFSDYILKTSTDINNENKLSILGIYTTESHLRDTYHYFKGEKADDNFDLELANQKEDKTLLGFNWRLLTGRNGFLNTNFYFSRIKQDEASGQINIDPIYNRKPLENEISKRYPIYNYNIDEKQFGMKSDFTYNFPGNYTLYTGIAIQRLTSDTKLFLNGTDTLYEYNSGETYGSDNFAIVTPDLFNSNFNNHRMEYAYYLESSFSPLEKIDLNAGIRYEYDDLSKRNYFSPRISGSYKAGLLTSVTFAAGVYYQMPLIREVAFNKNNLSLKNEKSYHFILGVNHYLADALKLTVESYYKKLEDLIVESNTNSNAAQNSGKGYAYGIDMGLIKKFVSNFYGQINYSYSQCKVKDDANGKFHYSDFNQPHMFNFLAGYQLDDHWSFSIKWKYATGRPKDGFIIHANVLNNSNKMRYSKEITDENVSRYNDYHGLNFRVDYRHQFTKLFAVSAYLDIMNVYNRENQTGENFQTLTGKTSYSSFPMMPTFGFKLEL